MKDTTQSISRRSFIIKASSGAAVFATASVGPWFIKDALSSSGTLNLLTWPDYSKPEVITAFEKATGIKVKVTCRPHSVFIGAGLYLDAIGKVPSNRMYDTYESEEKMKKIYDQILEFLNSHKKNIKMFWNNAQDHQPAFLQNGCQVLS